MSAIVRLALRDCRRRWRVLLSLGVMIAITVATLTMLDGYVRSVDVRFRSSQPRLVVQQESTVGEFVGSRIPASVADELKARGVAEPIAEIHVVTGTSGADAVLVAGVDPDRYRELDPYRLLSGRHLRSGETGRTAVIGRSLASRFGIGSGDTIRLRGRDFAVVGVFELGSYLDDAALLPLADAQRLLGWGSDVSLYVIPADGRLAAGELLAGGLVVSQRGDVALIDEWTPLLDLLTSAVRAMAIGAIAVVAVALWRLAWLHRVDLGLIRLLGFPRRAATVFLGTQAVVLVATAAGAGAAVAVLAAPRLARTTLAVTLTPVIDRVVLMRAALYALIVFVVALSIPLIALLRRGVGELVQRDD
jgi:hypothetical protein